MCALIGQKATSCTHQIREQKHGRNVYDHKLWYKSTLQDTHALYSTSLSQETSNPGNGMYVGSVHAKVC